MIASLRGLAILGGVAVLVLVLIAVGGRRPVALVDRALVPGLAVDDVTSLRWESPRSAVVRQLDRDRADPARWAWVAPRAGAADPTTVANLLATLRAARWHRRAPRAAAGAVTAALVVVAGGRSRRFEFGAPLEASAQAWMVVDDRALLVDAWVVRALTPDDLALAIRRPLDDVSRAPSFELGRVRFEGLPRRLVGETRVLAARSLVDEVERAVADLELVRVIAAPVAAVEPVRIQVGDVEATLGGPCPSPTGAAAGDADDVQLVTSLGAGCVPRSAADAVRAVAARLAAPEVEGRWRDELVELRPAPIEAVQITLVDGSVLALAGRPTVNGAPAELAKVAELLAVLAAPAVASAPRTTPVTPAPRTITVDGRGGAAIVLELVGPRRLRRAGEAVVLELTPAAWAVVTRAARDLREPRLWVEEPTTITVLEVDGVRYARGDVVGEWTRTPPGPVAAPALEALVAQLAAPQAIGEAAPAFASTLRAVLTVTPPGGPPISHVLELGPRHGAGCDARVDAVAVQLAARLCDPLRALAPR